MQAAKRACARLDLDRQPPRGASVASFMAFMPTLATASATDAA